MTEFHAERVQAVLRDGVASSLEEIGTSKVASAVQATVMIDGKLVLDEAFGYAEFGPDRALYPDTPIDLASLSKLFTATIAAQAVDEGLVTWSTPVAELVGGWDDDLADGDPATLLHLVNHSSGLPAWEKFYLRFPLDPTPDVASDTRREVLAEILKTERRPAGTRHEYSDLGYILLGHALEQIYQQPLELLVEGRIFDPLDMEEARYVSVFRGDAPIAHAAATERCRLRDRVVVGTVHDENTNIQGGVAGHAGAFGTARDVARFGQHMLDIDQMEADAPILRRDNLHFCWSDAARGADGHHLAGWDTPSGEKTSAGRGFSREQSVGHLGFTGTSLWIDRSRNVVAALLTNRVYPTRENDSIRDFRIRFHEAVLPPTS